MGEIQKGLLRGVGIALLLSTVGLQAAEEESEDGVMEFFMSEPAGMEIPEPAPLLVNAYAREYQSLNGMWNIKVDEPGLGWRVVTTGAYISASNRDQLTGMELIETAFDEREQLKVPGDWGSQREDLDRYRGKMLYHKIVPIDKQEGKEYYVHFGGANYKTDLFVNDQLVGRHEGGYTSFNFNITDYVEDGDNTLIVRVDAFLNDTTVPTMRTSDFWKYGGITRDVSLITVPDKHISQYHVYLNDRESGEIKAWVQMSDGVDRGRVTLSIPEVGIKARGDVGKDGRAEFTARANLTLWTPENPKLYDVHVQYGKGKAVKDKIGFRTFEARGQQVLLNGEPVELYGISMHEETPLREGVANTPEDARVQFELIKELGANFVRLAHYPHNEHTVRLADEMGLLVWSEIPIVSLIDWDNEHTLKIAKAQITDNISRDLNRASIAMWSIANESFPQSKERLEFLKVLADLTEALDESDRPIVAALIGNWKKEFTEVGNHLLYSLARNDALSRSERQRLSDMFEKSAPDHFDPDEEVRVTIDDKLGEVVDIVGYNEYFGWYYSSMFADSFGVDEGIVRKMMFELMPQIRFDNMFGKPMIISEFGAGAVAGRHSEEGHIWSEEYQAKVYGAQVDMLKRSAAVQGISPWILKDFRSHLRELNGVHGTYNRKGLVSETGEKKMAFDVLKQFYHEQRGL
jgi:beta-glucuronidase